MTDRPPRFFPVVPQVSAETCRSWGYMLHTRQIQTMIDEGQADAAETALENLLFLGPKNIDALKIKASLLRARGRFPEEARVWREILQIDGDDPDGGRHFYLQQLEEREQYYFTEDLPGGGRSFLAYPRAIVMRSAIGLAGCLIFLLVLRFASKVPAMNTVGGILGLFGVCIVVPWLAIIHAWLVSLHTVKLEKAGLTVASRLRHLSFGWSELSEIRLVSNLSGRGPELALEIIPHAVEEPVLSIDLSDDSGSVRARSLLLKDIEHFWGKPHAQGSASADLNNRTIIHF